MKKICQKHFLVSLFWLQIKNSSVSNVHSHQHSSYTRFYNFQLSSGEFFSLCLLIYIDITKLRIHININDIVKNFPIKQWYNIQWPIWIELIAGYHCVKSVQIWSVFWSVFSPNAGKYGPGKTPYLDTFHAVNGLFSCYTSKIKDNLKNKIFISEKNGTKKTRVFGLHQSFDLLCALYRFLICVTFHGKCFLGYFSFYKIDNQQRLKFFKIHFHASLISTWRKSGSKRISQYHFPWPCWQVACNRNLIWKLTEKRFLLKKTLNGT